MIRTITFSLSIFWSIFFAVQSLALLSATGWAGLGAVQGGLPGIAEFAAASPLIAIVLSSLFALCALLFVWAVLASLMLSGGDAPHLWDISAIAIAMAAVVLTLLVASTINIHSIALFEAVGLYIAALAGSYAAIAAERIATVDGAVDRDDAARARVMALSAAHNTLLTRISGRGDRHPESRL